MDIATEELSHLEMVGSMITMLLDGLNDDLKTANERWDWMESVARSDGREQIIHQVAANPLFFALTGGGPDEQYQRGALDGFACDRQRRSVGRPAQQSRR